MTDHARRRERAAGLIRDAGLDAAAFVPGPNFYYLTGLDFHLMERATLLIVTRSAEMIAVIPALDSLKWHSTYPDATAFFWQDKDGFEDAFAAAAAELGAVSVGVEGGRMRMFEYDGLCRHLKDGEVRNGESAMEALRIAKDADEIASLCRAIEISEVALEETLEKARAGDSECAISAMLQTRMLAHGAEGFAFEPLVLAGAKAANPHGMPDEAPVRPGDALIIDFGARLDGYNADITRTFFCERVSDRHAEIYETVLEANRLGRRLSKPGITAHELDTTVTDQLRNSPFADMIVHKLGHGLGLDVHEAPHIMEDNHQEMEPGFVITIEPGLYKADEIGVRIEDDVAITSGGAKSLTSFPRELRTFG